MCDLYYKHSLVFLVALAILPLMPQRLFSIFKAVDRQRSVKGAAFCATQLKQSRTSIGLIFAKPTQASFPLKSCLNL